MTDADLYHRFFVVSSVALGAGTLGIGFLLFAPRAWVGRAVVTTVAVVVMSGLAALLCPVALNWVAGGGAVAGVGTVLLGSSTARRLVEQGLKAICRPRVAGAAAVLAAGGVWGYEAWRFDRGYDTLMDDTLRLADVGTPAPTKPTSTAQTDRGSVIVLDSALTPLSAAEASEQERKSAPMRDHAGKFIRRRPAADEANCHGWVFTGGRYNIGGRFVDVILSENGYTPVQFPTAGDLCVYRDANGGVSHTGVVQAVLGDGTVLVESKWGRLGVYLHLAGESCYGTCFTYHRSERDGHRLRGVECDPETGSATLVQP